MKSLKKRIKRKYLFVYIHNRVNYSVKWKFYGLHVKKDEVYTVKVILQSIYWTYSWPCKQLKKIWSVICAQFKLLYHIPQDIVICLRCQELEKEGKKINRQEMSDKEGDKEGDREGDKEGDRESARTVPSSKACMLLQL